MRVFNEKYVIKEVESNYSKIFPDKIIKTVIFSNGFRNDKTGHITSMFFCFDPDQGLIGFAVHYGSKKILRLYNHNGEDMGLEFDMEFKSLKKGKEERQITVKKTY